MLDFKSFCDCKKSGIFWVAKAISKYSLWPWKYNFKEVIKPLDKDPSK